MKLLQFILFLALTAVVWVFPPLGIALSIGFVVMILWDDWKRDNGG